jgi:hypothetical protein
MTKARIPLRTHFIPLTHWERHHGLFIKEEIAQLNQAICGEAICPRGMVVAVTGVTQPLLDRLSQAVAREVAT